MTAPRSRQRGLSLVELMVGSAVSLTIAAGALQAHGTHLQQQRRLLVEARLQQDLRSATELIARQLRRSGYWQHALDGVGQRPFEDAAANPHAVVDTGATNTFGADVDDAPGARTDASTRWGLRLNGGRLQARLGTGNWQELGDPGFAVFEQLELNLATREIDLSSRCAAEACAPGTDCPPRQLLRSVAIRLRARASSDPTLVREAADTARLRNDEIVGVCPPA